MIDKLDTAVPYRSRFTKSFAKVVELSLTPEWEKKVWQDGGLYKRRGDFRAITHGELPIILHRWNKHDEKADDKIELVETGTMSMLDMVSLQQAVYDRDAEENRILRIDLTADVLGTGVQWFRDNVEVRHKQTHREWQMVGLNSRRSEQISAGRKPNQIRIYDKTGHRKVLLEAENRRLRRGDPDCEPVGFEARWGYSDKFIVTRVERQVAAKDVAKVGIAKVGHIWKAGTVDPFKQLVFPDDVKQRFPSLDSEFKMRIEEVIFAEWIRKRTLEQGWVYTRNEIFRMCSSRDAYYRLLKKYKQFALPIEGAAISRADLLRSYVSSIDRQMQKAA